MHVTSLLLFVFKVCAVFCFLVLVAITSAMDCLERLVSEVTYYVSSGTLNPTHSLAHFIVSPVCLQLYKFTVH